MRDLYNNVLPLRAKQIARISSSPIDTGNTIDLKGYESCEIFIDFGDIDELGASPVGSASIACKIEHADDDGTGAAGSYSACADADVIGHTNLSNGTFKTVTTDASLVRIGYKGGKRFVKITLTPTGLANGGPVGVWALLGHNRHAPV